MDTNSVFQLIIFAIASVGIILFSWPSLRNPQAHGFYRFFAFEAILALILLNLEHWFRDPFSTAQIVSWLLLTASLVMVIHGFYLLRVIGKPQGNLENTTILVTLGAYQYIRHPLYSSLLYLGWGAFFKDPSLPGGLLALIAAAALIATAKVEEAENIAKFGAAYARYKQTTRMFVPFLF